jgi:phage tail protein X
MSQTYITRQFDELDAICRQFYGRTQGTVEAVMAVNRDLADLMPILPQGLAIELPDLPQPSAAQTLRIWDLPASATAGTGAG